MPHDLLASPRWKPNHLGLPMPDDPHALSACLPVWADNIGYEEGEARVINKLQSAYPRFCFHPLINELCQRFLNSDGRRGLPFASEHCAKRAIQYVQTRGVQTVEQIELPDLGKVGVGVPEEDFATLKQYWQHAGEIVSSRVAEKCLAGEITAITNSVERQSVRQRIAELHDVSVENVFLYPSGMAAIAESWRLAKASKPNRPTCQFGFPYVDTLKIQERFPDSQHWFLPIGDDQQLMDLRSRCASANPAAIFCEVPTNPLLRVPDITNLRAVADKADSLLVIDDTLTACGNMKVLHLSDITVTSLTKYFSGYGNVLAGALILNPNGANYDQLKDILTSDFEELLSDEDVATLEVNSRDLSSRMDQINRNAAELVERLSSHDAIRDVYYPVLDDSSGLQNNLVDWFRVWRSVVDRAE